MAFSNSPLITCFLLILIPYAASISFNLSSIGPENQNKDIVTEGNGAYISEHGIQVTPDEIGSDRSARAGRAKYTKLFHLWDNESNELASFSTSFSFVIDSRGSTSYADGLTFFLAENNSVIANGGAMGLPVNNVNPNLATNPFVAVEFDTYRNTWDPFPVVTATNRDHVGININSLTSVTYTKWLSNVTGGSVCEAWITYNSVSKNLSVSFTGFQNDTVVRQSLHHIIDLRKELPEWVIFGFSGATGVDFQKNNVRSWNFSSSDLQVDENVAPPPNQNPGPDQVDGNNSKVGLLVGLSLTVIFLGLGVLGFFLWRKKNKSREDDEDEDEDGDPGFDIEMNNEFEMGTGPKRFSYQELALSTGDFSEEEKLGEGGFGGVYRGFLKDSNTYIAVKRVSKTSKQGIKEYAAEVRIISRLRHRNLVKLTGWCHKKKELLLVYEFMENGSLDMHLFNEKSLLTWSIRYKIAHGLASALFYLHEEWEQCVLHRDIKSSNVMLDSNFNAKLGDFGLAKLVDHDKGSQTTMLAGTFGYMAPECAITGKATKESDVFSYGVVALEITSGRRTIVKPAKGDPIRLVESVWELYGTETLLEAVDPKLGSDYEEEDVKRLMIVGLWCVHPDSDLRPSMRQVIQVLNSEASLPILPSKMPVASYMSSPTSSLSSMSKNHSSQCSTSNTASSKQRRSSALSPASLPSE